MASMTVALGAMAVSALGNAAGAYSGAKATEGMDKYQAQVAANDAIRAQQNANYAAAEGEARAGTQEMRTRAQAGAIKAAQGASGISVGSGSAVAVQNSAAKIGALDAMTIRSNAARQYYGFETQAQGDLEQSKLDTYEASQAGKSAPWAAFGSLLGSAGNISSKYAAWKTSTSGATGPSSAFPESTGDFGAQSTDQLRATFMSDG